MSDARVDQPRQRPGRPRVTLRDVGWAVLIFALFNASFNLRRPRLLASGLPPADTLRGWAGVNGLAVIACLWVFYGPWLLGLSRRQFVRSVWVTCRSLLLILPLGMSMHALM